MCGWCQGLPSGEVVVRSSYTAAEVPPPPSPPQCQAAGQEEKNPVEITSQVTQCKNGPLNTPILEALGGIWPILEMPLRQLVLTTCGVVTPFEVKWPFNEGHEAHQKTLRFAF